MLVEFAAFDSSVSIDNTAVDVDLSVGVFASVAMLLVGLLVGIIELVFLERVFRNRSFLVKIADKLLFYLVLMLTIIAVLYPIAVSIEFERDGWR